MPSRNPEPLETLKPEAQGLDYFNDGSQFATAGRDRLVRVYDEALENA